MSREVRLSPRVVAVIDDEDAPRVLVHRWVAHRARGRLYARSEEPLPGDTRSIALHRFIVGAPPDVTVEVLDGDLLNCTRANLVLLTKHEKAVRKARRAAATAQTRPMRRLIERHTDPRYYSWRQAVFKRDLYRCVECGDHATHDDKIYPHHIMGWANYPELRYDVNNGKTLCLKHHAAYHPWLKGQKGYHLSEEQKRRIGTANRLTTKARGDKNGRRMHPERFPTGDAHYARTHPERLSRGENRYNAKLTEAIVREICALYSTGNYSKRHLSRLYDVSHSLICAVLSGRAWAHITGGSHVEADERTSCIHGHLYTPKNTYHHPHGYRVCRTCHALACRAYCDRQKS